MEFNYQSIKQNMKNCQLQQLHQIVLGRKKYSKTRSTAQSEYFGSSEAKKFLTYNTISIFKYGLYSLNSAQKGTKILNKISNGLHYCIKEVGEPKESILKSKKVQLPQGRKKILFLDLDETLIHTREFRENLQEDQQNIKMLLSFFIRPYTLEFLKKMSKLYDIYIFTASTKDYSLPIVSMLNQQTKTIMGILHRKHCLRTSHGHYIKDLRIIANRTLDEMVLVDNNLHSFAFQIENGIPVESFKGQKNDRVLRNLQKFLKQLNTTKNIPQFLQKKLRLRQTLLNPIKSNDFNLYNKNNCQ